MHNWSPLVWSAAKNPVRMANKLMKTEYTTLLILYPQALLIICLERLERAQPGVYLLCRPNGEEKWQGCYESQETA